MYPRQKCRKYAIKSNRLFYRVRNNFESTLEGYWKIIGKKHTATSPGQLPGQGLRSGLTFATCHKSCVGYVCSDFTSLREYDELFKPNRGFSFMHIFVLKFLKLKTENMQYSSGLWYVYEARGMLERLTCIIAIHLSHASSVFCCL